MPKCLVCPRAQGLSQYSSVSSAYMLKCVKSPDTLRLPLEYPCSALGVLNAPYVSTSALRVLFVDSKSKKDLQHYNMTRN